MIVNDSVLVPKSSKTFCCVYCDYITSRKSQYERHLSTDKHKKAENDSKMVGNDSDLVQKSSKYECECGKIYKYDSGYYRHKKICNHVNIKSADEISDKELIVMLLKQNSQLIEKNTELTKSGISNTNNSHNNTNSNNKSFNLQFFLNETCKDAMNIMDFVDSIKLQLTDLENVGKLGYVEGISNIITTKLKSLDITQRPVHCTDKKREVLYVKDENKWEKEDEENKKLRKAIKRVASKNQNLLPQFKEAHPDCNKASSKFSDQYNKIIVESCGGPGDNDLEKENKIIKNITKVTTIDKIENN
jgi:hypothetical protein